MEIGVVEHQTCPGLWRVPAVITCKCTNKIGNGEQATPTWQFKLIEQQLAHL